MKGSASLIGARPAAETISAGTKLVRRTLAQPNPAGCVRAYFRLMAILRSDPVSNVSTTMPAPVGRYRWRVCALLFFATTLNYLDRQVLSILAPGLQKSLHWSEVDYGNLVAAFKFAYAIGLLGMGRFLDRTGTRRGYALGVGAWSLAGAAHALATGLLGFGAARLGLGLAEAVNFPAAVKTVAEWFPKRERAFATGIFNSGTNVGALLAPLVVPWLATRYGWQSAFLGTGMLGSVWIVWWLVAFRSPDAHPKLSDGERAWIQQDGPVESGATVPWRVLLSHRETVTVCILKFVTDPVWWFFLFWLPKFLNERFGVSLLELGPPMIVIYQVSSIGSVAGGWLSSRFIANGMTVDAARKRTILLSGMFALPIFWASKTDNLWTAVALVSLGTAAHQACSANIYTIISDIFPQRAVGSVVGLAAFSGAIAGAIIAEAVGWMLQTTGSYVPIFAMFSVAYVVAWGVLRVGIPTIRGITV